MEILQIQICTNYNDAIEKLKASEKEKAMHFCNNNKMV